MYKIPGHTALIMAAVLSLSSASAQELYIAPPPPGQSDFNAPPAVHSAIPPPPTPQPFASPGIAYQSPPIPTAPPASMAPVAPEAPAQCYVERQTESTWYARVDYFHWNESIRGENFVNEDGTLTSIGHVRRSGPERIRVELFGGTMHYDGCGQYTDGSTEPFSNGSTGYFGARAEGELLLEPEWWPRTTFFLGVGTRFWIRDLKDGYSDYGNPIWGYQETWWTIYPYLGMEKKHNLQNDFEFYAAGRIGFTAATYQHVEVDDLSLYPKAGLISQLEGGVRGRRVFLSLFFETMNWGESDVVRDSVQPASRMLTLGIRTGLTF
jgi:hypothetical protein